MPTSSPVTSRRGSPRRPRDACAIGECGLDGGTGARALQEQIFRAHVRAARAQASRS